MIGRNEQIAQARRFVEAALGASATSNVLFVTGEAGIGKSTLLRMIDSECREMTPPPLVGLTACSTPLAGQDLGAIEALEPWAQIMAQLATEPTRAQGTRKIAAELAMAWVRVIPVVGDVLESIGDTAKIVRRHSGAEPAERTAPTAASQQQLFQQYINFLGELATRTPLVLMLDDFHWADSSSTNLLFAAARQLLDRPIAFIIAYRPDDASSSRAGEGHPILHVRNELERYSLCEELGVPQMTAADLDALLRERYPSYVNNDAFEEWIARVSGGNALFITQFLTTLEEDGMIDRERGDIKPGFEKIRVPQSAVAVVQERIRRLDEPTRELLRYASVEGDTFTSLVLSRISEMPQLKLLQRLRLAEESHGFVRALGKQRVYRRETSAWQFTHALLHKSVYDALLDEERELLHAAVLDVLKEELDIAREERVNLAGVAARVALHAEVLGDLELAASVLLEGAAATWKEYAEEETLRLLDGCIDFLDRIGEAASGSVAERTRIRAKAYMLRAYVHRVRGRFDDAMRFAEMARDLVAGTEHVQLHNEALNDIASTLRQLNDHTEAAAVATEALVEAQRIGYWEGESRALTTLGHVQANYGKAREALDWYERSLEVARSHAPGGPHEATALDNMGSMHSGLGDPVLASECYRQSYAILDAAGDIKGRADVQLNIGVLKFEQGDFAAAVEDFEQCLATFRAVGDLPSEAMILNNLGSTYFHLHRNEEALSALRRAHDISLIVSDRRAEAASLDNIGLVEHRQGDRLAATNTMLEALAIHEAIENYAGMVVTLHNLAWLQRELGAFANAHAYLDRALELARGTGQRDLIANVLTEMGLLAEDEAKALSGEDADAARRRAAELLEEGASILRAIGNSRTKDAEDALERVRSITTI